MALGRLRACLEQIWPFEGGYVDHPKDPGGAVRGSKMASVLTGVCREAYQAV